MKVLDLFSGLNGWSRPFQGRGHTVVTVDIDPSFQPTLVRDIRRLRPTEILAACGGFPDVILASPPCETFSVASIGTHWGGGSRAYHPKTSAAIQGKQLVEATVNLIRVLRPSVAVIENPRGVLRKLDLIPVEPKTVWYCHYGETHAKPTDLWGLPFPKGWSPRPECHNQRSNHPLSCCCRDHESAKRGAKTGTQGIKGYANRSIIPEKLAELIRDACEVYL